ncbi:hypothetical protein N7499_011912 [Penicillium canescens]|nr:hypothetical protein N7499_011912 [Penicillium canescens]
MSLEVLCILPCRPWGFTYDIYTGMKTLFPGLALSSSAPIHGSWPNKRRAEDVLATTCHSTEETRRHHHGRNNMPLEAVCDEQMSAERTWCAGRMFHVETDLALETLQAVYKAQPAFVVTYDDEILFVEFIVSCGGGPV